MAMQQTRIQRRARLLRPDLNDVLPLDPRDPDVIRAKPPRLLARSAGAADPKPRRHRDLRLGTERRLVESWDGPDSSPLMTLVLDTSVLYAAMDRRDRSHLDCRALIETAQEQVAIPAPILPQVDYWVSKGRGMGAMIALLRESPREPMAWWTWSGVTTNGWPRSSTATRISTWICRCGGDGHRGAPGEGKLATLDRRHFSNIRPRHVEALELLPQGASGVVTRAATT
jgi:uncharacterized protein